MGVDIHGPFVEYRYNGGGYWFSAAEMHWFRSTSLFQLMAGVRGGSPLVEPRGRPKDIGSAWDGHIREDCHSFSWLLPKELRRVRKMFRRVLREEWGEEAITPDLDALVAFVKILRTKGKSGTEVRIGFCFDN